jgi:hypothetical protein
VVNALADPSSLAVETRTQQNCSLAVPSDWTISVAADSGGLDAISADGQSDVSWGILPVNEAIAPYAAMEPSPMNNPALYSSDPATVAGGYINMSTSMLKGVGDLTLSSATPITAGSYTLLFFRGSTHSAYALYATFPGGATGISYYEALRYAIVPNGQWSAMASNVFQMALSVRCQTQLSETTGSSPDPSMIDSAISSSSGSDDNTYNPILGTEYVNDPSTGALYLVDSSSYTENGPDGPGYYAVNGNDITKLTPGLG